MTPPTDNKIILNFEWKGPTSWHGGWSEGGYEVSVVDLVFQNAKSVISVHIPEMGAESSAKKLPFTVRRYLGTESPVIKETHPDSLKVTIEQIRNLTIKAGILEENPSKGTCTMNSSGQITREQRILRTDELIKLKVPEELEIGQTYRLVVESHHSSFSAHLVQDRKEEKSVNHSDLDALDTKELLSRFEAAYTRDKELEGQRIQMASQGNIHEMAAIVDKELKNSRLVVDLTNALEKRGVKAQFLPSERFQRAERESAKAQAELIKNLDGECLLQ